MSAGSLDGRELAGALRQVLPAVGTDRKRPALHGVLLEATDDSLRIVATDAHRLAVREIAPATGSAGRFRAVVGGTALAALVDWLDRPNEVSITADDAALILDMDGDRQALSTMIVDYPDVGPLLAASPDAQRVVLRRVDLVDLLEQLPDAPFARLRCAGRILTIIASEAEETMAAVYDGDGIDTTLDPVYLHDAAMAFVEPDLAVDVAAPKAPIVITAAEGGSLTYMIMPIRTS